MAQKVFLTSKKVFLDIQEGLENEDSLIEQINASLLKPTKVVKKAKEWVVNAGSDLTITKRGKLLLGENRNGYILAINCKCCEICGLFFYEDGDTYMTQMADPDCKKWVKVVEGN